MLVNARRVSTSADSDSSSEVPNTVVLDVRNSYEWDAGHFEGVARPAEEYFNETPRAEGDDAADGIPEPLRGADPDTPVMVRTGSQS